MTETGEHLHVLIVGGGITGLTIAQGLTKAGIRCTVFESEPSAAVYRPREWGMAIHWSLPMLQKCLPVHLADQLKSIQTDPFYDPPADGVVPMYNGETGELIKALPVPKMYRVSRRKIRTLCAEGIMIEASLPTMISLREASLRKQYGKAIAKINAGADHVTATFVDGSKATGSILIGTDGAHSTVRNLLVGPEKGNTTDLPYILSNVTVKYPTAEQALATRRHPVQFMGIHPNGTWTWISVLDVTEADKPESTTFQLMTSWKRGPDEPTGPLTLARLKEKTSVISEPFRSANQWLADDTIVSENRLSYWIPVQWDNHGGRVTLAGDSAHPMVPYRGQGLNHAINDAFDVVAAMEKVHAGKATLAEAVGAYETEMIQRGAEEVKASVVNGEMLHNWEALANSPLMKKSAAR